jgi:argininosuccinate lyase
MLTAHNTPFGDIVDTEDDVQPLVASMFRDTLRALILVTLTVRGLELDVARLEARAAEGGTTLTELADHLVRERGVPFTKAHAVASRFATVHRGQADVALGQALDVVAIDVLGIPLEYSDARIAQILSPRHFVDVRRTHGGPAPEETARAVAEARRRLDDDGQWLTRAREGVAAADARRREMSGAL